jgi:hypothetical protein
MCKCYHMSLWARTCERGREVVWCVRACAVCAVCAVCVCVCVCVARAVCVRVRVCVRACMLL